jgi:hypothetical protein
MPIVTAHCYVIVILSADVTHPVSRLSCLLLQLLTSHLQLLGLLRPLRIKWPEALQKLLQHVDPSSALMAWARLDCSMADAAAVRRSVQRSVVLLLTPGALCTAVYCAWLWYRTAGSTSATCIAEDTLQTLLKLCRFWAALWA